MQTKIRFVSKNFDDERKIDGFLNSFAPSSIEIVGYSAYGIGDIRYHTEFTAGVFITIKETYTVNEASLHH